MSQPVRLAVFTPVLVGWPGLSASWEETAGIEELVRIAELADQLGYHHLTCSEHVGVPQDAQSAMLAGQRGTRYWDPLATLSYLAACTKQIRLATNVLVLGYHHPLAIAKQFGTLDRISDGRLILGVGVGSLREEFDAIGASFDDRGARADDSIRALRSALSNRMPAYDGPYYSFEGLAIEPHALQQKVPIWVGGNSRRALRRAVTLGDGWAPGPVTPASLRAALADLPERAPGFEVVVYPGKPLDPIKAPEATLSALEQLADAGATIVAVTFAHDSLAHYCEQLEALAALSGDRHTTTLQLAR